MLASLTDRLFVFVSPSRVMMIHTRLGLFRRNVISKRTEIISVSEYGKVDVDAIASALTEVLTGLNVKSAKLEMVLSGSLTRADVLPPLHQPLTLSEHLKRAQLHFQKVFGEVANKWAFCLDDVQFNQSTLTAAIDKDLLKQLQDVAKNLGLNLMIAEPVLARILRCWEKQFINKPIWIVVTEDALCSIVKFNQDGLSSVSQISCSKAFSSEELQTLLLRESLRSGDSLHEKELYLFLPDKLDFSVDIEGVRLHTLKSTTPNVNYQYSDAGFLSLIKQA